MEIIKENEKIKLDYEENKAFNIVCTVLDIICDTASDDLSVLAGNALGYLQEIEEYFE